jgi:hypothetical protein
LLEYSSLNSSSFSCFYRLLNPCLSSSFRSSFTFLTSTFLSFWLLSLTFQPFLHFPFSASTPYATAYRWLFLSPRQFFEMSYLQVGFKSASSWVKLGQVIPICPLPLSSFLQLQVLFLIQFSPAKVLRTYHKCWQPFLASPFL